MRIRSLLVACILSIVWSGSSNAGLILYDNTSIPFGEIIIGPRFGPGEDARIAQPFLSNGATKVSSVSIGLQRLGLPSGTVRVEIWDDDGSGVPGALVGTVGTLGAMSLSTEAEFVVFDDPVFGLAMDSSYFVVLDASEVVIPDLDNTFRFADATSDFGTNGAGKLLAEVGTEWLVLDDLLGPGPGGRRANFLQMSVASVPQPPTMLLLALGLVGAALISKGRTH